MASTLAQLETRARYAADMVGSDFVTTTEWARYLNEGYRELWNLVRQACGDHFVTSTAVAIADAATNYASLAAVTDFGRLLSVELVNSATADDVEIIPRFNWSERNRQSRRSHRLMGQRLYIEPAQLSPGTYTVWYEPRVTELSGISTVSPLVDEWEEYLVLFAAICALEKEETDASGLRVRLYGPRGDGGMKGDILNLAANRDAGEPQKIRDVYPTAPYLPARLPRP